MPTPEPLLSMLKERSGDPDAMVLIRMAEIGADLRKPHEPEFAFEADQAPSADAIARELRRLGYAVHIYEPDDDVPHFEVVAKCRMILDLSALNQLTARFEAIAKDHHVTYDGWGADIVE